ncbi:RloB family protein [Chitinophaga sp.]|uniref:RloB family protein n=1 Tax=Chitinophaga sp. TaxID=1869181 RepID=UPI0031D98811
MAKRGKTSFNKEQESGEVRVEKWRKYLRFLLVVCEDQNTEPTYIKTFKRHFPAHSLYLEVAGVGLDPLGVVNKTIEKIEELKGLTKREIDEVWTVFDKDDADLNQARAARFDEAFATAKLHRINIAWSNEVFELWFLLHFEEVSPDIPIPRAAIYERLKNAVNNSVGQNVISDGHSNVDIIPYLRSHGSELDAINRAKALARHFSNTAIIGSNPASKMYQLVESLNSWIAYYNFRC